MDKCMDKGRNYLLLEHQENNQKVFTDLSELKSYLFFEDFTAQAMLEVFKY